MHSALRKLKSWEVKAALVLTFVLSSSLQAAPGAKSGFLPGARSLGTQQLAANDPPPSLAKPGAPGLNPSFGGGAIKPNPSAPNKPGSFNDFGYLDDDDEDFDDDFTTGFPAPGGAKPLTAGSAAAAAAAANNPGFPPGGISAGGQPRSEGNNPIRTSSGIAVGGSSPNNVISKTTIAPIKIDNESAKGSKDIITDFNFPDVEIMDLARTVGKLFGKNFIFDKDVKGRIGIITNGPVTASQVWEAFLTTLDANQFAIVPSGQYLRIIRQRDARDKQLRIYSGNNNAPDTDALVTQIFTLKYMDSEEMVRIFRSIMPATARIVGLPQGVMVTDTGANISKLVKIVEIVDIEGFDAGIEVIPVKYASAAELAKLIDTLIPGTGSLSQSGAPGMPRFPGAPGGPGGRFHARRTKEGGIINNILADDRTNKLIVHANPKGVEQVRELVAKLDQKVPTTQGGGRVRVVYLQFADAEQLANTLNNISSQAGARQGGFPMPPGGGGGTGSNPIAGSLFEGAIKIAPDKATNSLVITASPSDFVTVQRVINRLDIPREQVYVEVVIMDVKINRDFNYSVNAANPSRMQGLMTKPSDSQFLLNGPLGLLSSGAGGLFAIPFSAFKDQRLPNGQTVNMPDAFALIKALQSNGNANILATPQIIALDNSDALFESSDKVPVPSTTYIQGSGAAQSITKEPITLSIKLKPQINKITNFVKLDIQTKLADINQSIVPSALANTAVGSTERNAQTTVVVADSDTIVLGGLIRDKIEETVNKIPLLGDIPLVGWLFRSKTSSVEKRNLLIFMTPHIIRQYEKIRTILDKKLKERDEFLEESTGGEDPLRSKRDAIIRSLPNLKELIEQHPPTTVILDEDKDLENKGAGSGSGSTPGARFIHPKDSQTENHGLTQNPASTQPAPEIPPVDQGQAPMDFPPPIDAGPTPEFVPQPMSESGVPGVQ
ncbi:type II secretion system protein GspD [bacterium]|jgi:general secretion pathway protein D|nr:type II secretion system protein GspD [bacterium]